MSARSSRFDLPGFSLPLDYNIENHRQRFPNALDPHFDEELSGRYDTYREIVMRQITNTVIEKPDWNRKVFNEEITAKWRQEIAASGRDVSSNMMDWIIKELRWKAGYLAESGMIPVFDTGVVISDTAIPPELQQELQRAVAPLEMLKKDYHPGSDKKVVDLVHPSLFPVIYGRSRILPDTFMGLDDCLGHAGEGQLLPTPTTTLSKPDRWGSDLAHLRIFSQKFQWMPCDVEFAEEDGSCRIVSYINNLHPKKYRPLYGVIERIITRTIPLWNNTLSNCETERRRMDWWNAEYVPESPGSSYSDWERDRQLVQPEPGEFEPKVVTPEDTINLRKQFPSGLQVIVKLANIELIPENPTYDGGSWHVEGALNEHICATAIYYYESVNITASDSLAFRQRAPPHAINDMPYEQHDHRFLQEIFGFPEHVTGYGPTQVTQEIGSIRTKQGRLLTFPNTLQHRVSPFELADKSKPGCRKILALFLVDPHFRIISSANIPPQREDWWEEKQEAIFSEGVLARLPVELQDMVLQHVDVGHVTFDEACQYRLELMEERRVRAREDNEAFETGDFGLCEH
ncbi:hypothetical protein BDV10DRAFT_50747 [Aspergillus recurvatus]